LSSVQAANNPAISAQKSVAEESGPLLDVQDLRTYFSTPEGEVPAVDGVSFSVKAGQTLALLGESGCGKSVTALSLLRLLEYPPAHHPSGRIYFEGVDLLQLPMGELRKRRGGSISMIFQEPMTSLNPVFTVGNQLLEAIKLHQNLNDQEALDRAVESLRQVQIPSPADRLANYPHEMSGGMQQRVMIAMALACDPEFLIADEPTTALDVTVQAEVLELLGRLRIEKKLAMLFITHDLGVAASVADRVAVMYAGRIAEIASAENIYRNPQHPYTVGLFKSVPVMGRTGERLYQIPGQVPSPLDFPTGCRFHPRCPRASDQCRREHPELTPIPGQDDHAIACWHPESGVGQ
jgi:peptide/nickel transport system ATP-binding protein